MKWTRSWIKLSLAALLTTAACDDGTTTLELSPPTGLQVTAIDVGVELGWMPAGRAEAYTVERDRIGDDAGFAVLAERVLETRHLDASVVEGAVYQYRIRSLRGGEVSHPTEAKEVEVGHRRAALGGTITGKRRLSADTTYVLQGVVTVANGAELHIPAGTLVLGDVSVQPSVLIVRRGGKIFADGTAEAPIVFTSSVPVGQRKRGDWGGVVLNGASYCNFPASQCIGEGSSGEYGGSDPDDDSGRMTYVRIEYCGYEVSFGNELNCLTLNGVGRGTTLHHIQAHMGSDDGIEFFGGTVDVKYALVTGASDDSFDYSTGWQGRGQFWIAQQDPNDADRGFEVDGNENDYNATPLTNPLIFNVTLVGKGTAGVAGESKTGIELRRGTAGKIRNAIVIGFENGLDINNAETFGRCASGDLLVADAIFFGNGKRLKGTEEEVCASLDSWTHRAVDPQLASPYDLAAPDFRPESGSPALHGLASPPNDGFFEAVSFVGGVGAEGPPWYQGWTTTARS